MSKCETHHSACACREAMLARAVEIADKASVELLQSQARRLDDYGIVWALTDTFGADVATLAEADPSLVEAVQWLQQRDLCSLVESVDGTTLIVRPME